MADSQFADPVLEQELRELLDEVNIGQLHPTDVKRIVLRLAEWARGGHLWTVGTGGDRDIQELLKQIFAEWGLADDPYMRMIAHWAEMAQILKANGMLSANE